MKSEDQRPECVILALNRALEVNELYVYNISSIRFLNLCLPFQVTLAKWKTSSKVNDKTFDAFKASGKYLKY